MKHVQSISKFGITKEKFDGILRHNLQTDDDSSAVRGMSEVDDYMYNGGLIIDPSNSDPLRGNSDQSQRMKVNELLGAWYVVVGIVELHFATIAHRTNVSIGLLLAFREEPEAELGAEVSRFR